MSRDKEKNTKTMEDNYIANVNAFRERIIKEELGTKLLINIFVGLGNSPLNREENLQQFERVVSVNYGGITKTFSTGMYKATNDSMISENTIVYTVVINDTVTNYEDLLSLVQELKIMLEQESILVTKHHINSELV